MNARERVSLALVADHAWKAQYDLLWEARSRASHALFLANTMGDRGGPKLILQRQEELKEAKRRLRQWVLDNPSSCSQAMLREAEEADYCDRLAERAAGPALAELKTRIVAKP